MKYCSNCGTACEDEVKFCENCGTSLQKNQQKYKKDYYSNQLNADYVSTNDSQAISTGIKILLYIITMFITFVGIIVGIIYMSDPIEEKKRFGKGLLIFAIIWTIIAFILPIIGFFLLFSPLHGIHHMYF